MPTSSSVTVRHHTGDQALNVFDQVFAAYRDVFAEPPHSQTEEDFKNYQFRFRRLIARPSFAMATAWAEGKLIGFAYGTPLGPGTKWWDNLLTALPAAYTAESGERTFAVIDFGVRNPWRGQGVGRRLHDELLGGRSEERATLAIIPAATATRAIYEHWGWRKVVRLKEMDPTAPHGIFDIMVLPLFRAAPADDQDAT
jgi:GNAT superfamily N-acetyltransferase